jgi:hypothetical protein
MYLLGSECPVCGVVALGIRVCVGTDESLIVLCDECDSIWLDPELKDGSYASEHPEWLCPDSDRTLKSPKSYWATEEQIKAIGWWQYIVHHEVSNQDKNTLNNE